MKAGGRQRLDELLVEKGLAESRAKARALILAGQVLVDGQKAGKAGQGVALESRIEILERLPYVSRGGLKLEAALEGFGIQVEERVCLDIGASTGGFTGPRPAHCCGPACAWAPSVPGLTRGNWRR